jgi:hypothetical protein
MTASQRVCIAVAIGAISACGDSTSAKERDARSNAQSGGSKASDGGRPKDDASMSDAGSISHPDPNATEGSGCRHYKQALAEYYHSCDRTTISPSPVDGGFDEFTCVSDSEVAVIENGQYKALEECAALIDSLNGGDVCVVYREHICKVGLLKSSDRDAGGP